MTSPPPSCAYDYLGDFVNQRGGDVAVDNITLAASNQSIRYSSSLDLGFRRETYDAADNRIGDPIFPALTVVGGGTTLQPRLVTLMELNAINPTRMVISELSSVINIFDSVSVQKIPSWKCEASYRKKDEREDRAEWLMISLTASSSMRDGVFGSDNGRSSNLRKT
jgi:hypothetical protein